MVDRVFAPLIGNSKGGDPVILTLSVLQSVSFQVLHQTLVNSVHTLSCCVFSGGWQALP